MGPDLFPTMLAMGDDEIIGLVTIAGGLGVAVIAIVAVQIKGIARSRMQETSRREIAAYIAEGSITPEEGERLLKASPDRRRC